MQAQTSSNAALSNPDIPSQKWLNLVIAVGITLLVSGLIMGGYSLYVDVLNPHYRYILEEFHEYYRTDEVKARGITSLYWLPPLIWGVVIVALFGAIKWERNHHWFREVLEGKIVDEHEELLFFGGRIYYFVIEGRNRAGEIRRQTRQVGSKKFFDYDVGDEISFKKE